MRLPCQITIPIEFRRELGIGADTMLQARVEDCELRLRPVAVAVGDEGSGSWWLRELYDHFAPVRQEAINKGYTEQQIIGWIDDAVLEVRVERATRDQRD